MAINWNTAPTASTGGIKWNTPAAPAPSSDSFHALSTNSSAGVNLAPTTSRSFGELGNELSGLFSSFPGAQIGNAIGTDIGYGSQAAKEALKGNFDIAGNLLKSAADINGANSGKIIGDTVQAAALPASMAVANPEVVSGKGLLPFLGRAGINGGYGAAIAGGNTAANGGSAADTAKSSALGFGFGAGGSVAADTLGALAGSTKGASQALMNKVARINPSDAENFSHMSGGQTPGQFLDQRGIYGNAQSVIGQLFNRFSQSKSAVDTALSNLPGLYKNQTVETALQDVLSQAKATSAPGAPSPYLQDAQTLLTKAQKDGLTMSEINDAKRLYERTTKLNYIKDQNVQGIERSNNIDSAIRTWQQDTANKLGFTNIQQLNKETQLTKSLIDAIGKKQNAQIGNNMVGLTDWIVASGIPHDPSSVALLLGKKLLGSGTGQGALARLFSSGEKLDAPSATIGAMNTNPEIPGLPGTGETSAASNLPPVIHAPETKLNPADTQTGAAKLQLSANPNMPPSTNNINIQNIADTLPQTGKEASPLLTPKSSSSPKTITQKIADAFKTNPRGMVKIGPSKTPFTKEQIASATDNYKEYFLNRVNELVKSQSITDLDHEAKLKTFAKYLQNKGTPDMKDVSDVAFYLKAVGDKPKNFADFLEEEAKQARDDKGRFMKK